MTPILRLLLAAALMASAPAAMAQKELPPIPASVEDSYTKLTARSEVAEALAAIKGAGVRMFEEQVRINEVPAPPFKEQVRAE